MRDQRQFKAAQYKSYFINRKRNNTIHSIMSIILGIGFIVGLIDLILIETDYSHMIISICGSICIIIFFMVKLFYSIDAWTDIEKERQELIKKIEELEKEMSQQEIALEKKFKVIEPKDKEEVDRLQENIWDLQFQLEMIGGEDRISLR
jgi:hypothetical protein